MRWTAKWLNSFLIAGGVTLIIFSASPAQGKEASLIQSTNYRGIDWSTGVITAQGIGLETARQNLWKVIKGLKVDNQHLMGELISANASFKEQIQRLIQRAKVIEEKKSATEQIEVRLQLSLNGPFTEAILAVQPVGNSGQPPVRRGPPSNNPGPSGPVFKLGPTGLVVDARGLRVEPALFPQILSEDDQLIYGLAKISRSYVVQQGMVEYMHDAAIAEASKRVANNPIVIKALRVVPDTDTDLIISNQDADRIRRASQQDDFLHKCRVIIVIDQHNSAQDMD